ncbi:MAG: RNA methyltransferase [Patescibacteria group bacterium]|nr:RNA methyltransferase [Patescibacteria group bacterium]
MLSINQEKLIRSLSTKKGREKNGLCLVEGEKVIKTAGDAIEYTFTNKDTSDFDKLVTTETPQNIAAVASIPKLTLDDIMSNKIIVVLDGVQDPGNVGSILRLCLGFNASLILIDSADVTNPKVVRSSVGAMFHVPWMHVSAKESSKLIKSLDMPIYRLEKKKDAIDIKKAKLKKPLILIAGSEGGGIQSKIKGESIYINHNDKLESLNVGHSIAIALHALL